MNSAKSRRSSFEFLEDRRLLAGGIYATHQIADVRQLAAMFAPQRLSENELRVDLAEKGLNLRPEDILAEVKSAQREYFGITNDQILVSVMGRTTPEELLATLGAVRFEVQFASPNLPVVDGYIALSELSSLVNLPQIAAIIPLNPNHLTDSVGTVANQAEDVLRGPR